MGARFRLTASALAVAAAVCLGAAAGRVVGPIGDEAPASRHVRQPGAAEHAAPRDGASGDGASADGASADHASGDGASTRGASGASVEHGRHRAGPPSGDSAAPSPATAGLLATAEGYTFSAETTVLDGGPGSPFRFRITDPAGAVVHEYAVTHERRLHLVLVSRDLAAYHHLHPTLAADGGWTVTLPALTPGAYRAFAGFTVQGGPALTLGLDLFVPGGALYSPLPAPQGRVEVHGYDVSLTGAPALGEGGEVALTVTSGGAPVTDLAPYLGALGHLVVVRTSDLALVHAHPAGPEPAATTTGPAPTTGAGGGAAGPTVRFHVAVGAPGEHRMFFEFAHGGVVHTAPFTVHVASPPP
jgi:hypothetical protein